MGLFDIFKSGKKENAFPENIDEIFDLASKDIAYRPLFYRTVLETKLYFLIYPDGELPKGEFTANKDTTLNVKVLADGKVPIFTSVDRIYDNGVITSQEAWISMKGRKLFEMFLEPTGFLLNPYSRPTKKFLPEEIKRLLAGELYESGEDRTRKAGAKISIGTPARYPTTLVEAVKKYCDTRAEIKGAYLTLMHDEDSGEAPHLLMGLDITENVKQIFGEIGEIIKPLIPKNEPLDLMNVSDEGTTSRVLKQNEYRIY